MTTNEFLKLAMVDEGMAAARAKKEREAAEAAEAAAKVGAAAKKVDAALQAGPVAPAGSRELRLEALSLDQRWALMAASEALEAKELSAKLESYGYQASQATLGRFLKKLRPAEALEEGAILAEGAERLVAQGKGAALRGGSLEVIRQKMFEEAMQCTNSEKRMRMYEALVGEEERLKKLALEEEKARQNAQRLELEQRRLEIAAAKNGGGKYFAELLRVLLDEKLEDRAKVAQAVERVRNWKAGAIEVGCDVKRLEEKTEN